MGIEDMGDGRVYKTYSDGSRELLFPEAMSYVVDGKKVLGYDKIFGLLKINKELFPQGTLESLSQEAINHPDGFEFALDTLGERIYLDGIKRVEYLSPEDLLLEEVLFASEQHTKRQDIKSREGIIQKIQKFLKNN